MKIVKYLFVGLLSIGLFACQEDSSTSKSNSDKAEPVKKHINVPVFNADSAYMFIEKQLAFGYRVPGTKEHTDCANWLGMMMNKYTGSGMIQQANVTAFDGTILPLKNIIGMINPDAKKRIVIAAHWDSRPFADQDDERQDEPIMAANDGASGVAIILEIARLVSLNRLNIGIDFVLFDAEDYSKTLDGYCLGSKHWSKKRGYPGKTPNWGILMDMVGAKDAKFYMEGYSMQFAPDLVRKVWDQAAVLGYGNYFLYEKEMEVIDDHLYMNRIAGIPTIDIIQRDRNNLSRFADYWHTHDDNIDIIDKATLKAVGQTVTAVIYNEDY